MALAPRQSCPGLSCPQTPPACPACDAGQECQIIGTSCTRCAYTICVPVSSAPSATDGGGGISTGALVGAIVTAVVVLILAGLGVVYFRRRAAAKRARDVRKSTSTGEKSTQSGRTAKDGSPVVATPDARNPFSDLHTAESGVSYMAPQGLPGTGDEAMPDHPYARGGRPVSAAPARPSRSPDLTLKAPEPSYARPDKKDKRQSTQTTGSSVMSDSESTVTVELYDARTQSATRHIFGAPAKALVVPINASSPSLPLQRSPLGQASYSADQYEPGTPTTHLDPFADGDNRPVSRNSMNTVATYDPDNVQIMNATLATRQSGSSSSTGHVVVKGPIAARANLLPIRVPPQSMPSLVAYQTAIGQAAARAPPSPHDSLGHARHMSTATMATTASGFSTSSSLLSSFPFVPPSPLGLPRQRSPESMTFSVREGEEGMQAIQVEKPTPPPPQSRPTSVWSSVSGASSAPAHPPLPGSVPPVPAIPAGLPRRALSTTTSRASTMTTGSILSAFPFHIPASAHTSAVPLSALPSSVALPDHHGMRDSMRDSMTGTDKTGLRSRRASLDSVMLSKQVGELGGLDD